MPLIPDYLIYDEIKKRREREASQQERLEMPLYHPEIPYREPGEPSEVEEDAPERGVFIIDMNDLIEVEPD